MAITKVPNGPLIKKKGPYAGSTLKNGGKLKKAQGGEYLTKEGNKYTATKKVKTKNGPRYYQGSSPSMSFAREIASNKALGVNDSIPKAKLSARALEIMNKKNGGTMKKKAQQGVKIGNTTYTITNSTKDTIKSNPKYTGIRTPRTSTGGGKEDEGISNVKKLLKSKAKNGSKVKKAMVGAIMSLAGGKDNPIYKKTTEMRGKIGNAKGIPGKPIVKNGGMLKRADGSYSKRGLWDNIRANKGSGKKPTAAMLKQERKIKAKSKK